MADYSSPWGALGNMQRPNTQMMQYGMQMMQPRPVAKGGYPPGVNSLVAQGPMPPPATSPFLPQPDGQPQDEAPSPTGKRRIRIGNKTYIEEDDTAAAPSTQIGSRSY
jgi:hypothetical protein